MKCKGLIAFVLVFLFILIYFNLVYSLNSFNSEKNFAEAKTIEIENTSFKRNLAENAIDSVIEEEIQKEIAFGTTEPEKLKEKISEKLIEVFSVLEEQEIEFKEVNSNKKYNKIKIKGKKVEKEFLEKNSKIIVINLKETVYLVEFIYTGGLEKNNLIGAEIKEKNSYTNFFIPFNYSQKQVAVKGII